MVEQGEPWTTRRRFERMFCVAREGSLWPALPVRYASQRKASPGFFTSITLVNPNDPLKYDLTGAALICPSCYFAAPFILDLDRKSATHLAPSRAREEGRIAIVTKRGAGMRWARQLHKTNDACPRTAKSCGPDAPTLASSS
jgi:hypothetical protein